LATPMNGPAFLECVPCLDQLMPSMTTCTWGYNPNYSTFGFPQLWCYVHVSIVGTHHRWQTSQR
jgi:hypothetical protein